MCNFCKIGRETLMLSDFQGKKYDFIIIFQTGRCPLKENGQNITSQNPHTSKKF
jgi:hypothetical protein